MLDRVVLRKIRDYLLREEEKLPEGSLRILRGEEIKTISHYASWYPNIISNSSIALVWELREFNYDDGIVHDSVTWAGYFADKNVFFRGEKTSWGNEVEFVNSDVVYFRRGLSYEWEDRKVGPSFKKLKEKIIRDLRYYHLPDWLGNHVIRCHEKVTASDLDRIIPEGTLVDEYFYYTGDSVIGEFLLERDGKLQTVEFRNTIDLDDYPSCLFAPDDDVGPVEAGRSRYTDSLQDGDIIWGVNFIICDEDDDYNEEKTIVFAHPIFWVSNKGKEMGKAA